MKTNFTKVCAGIAGTLMLSALGLSSNAQITYPYTGGFESANTNPDNKSYASLDTITMNGAKWVMPQVFLGTMLANDRKVGDKSARMRSQATEKGAIIGVQNFPQGIGTMSYKAARYGTDAIDSIDVFYSSNNGISWILAGTNPITDTVLNTFTHTLNIAGDVRIKLQKRTFATGRINIDDINITSHTGTVIPQLNFTSMTPMGANIPLNTDSITVTFSNNITAGAGNITLFKVGQTTPVHTFAASAGTISGSKIKFSPIVLDNATSYYVTVDSSLALFGTVGNSPITNNTTWTFSTVDTVTPPPPTPLTSLNEKFLNCINTEMGVFVEYNETGSATWRCSRFGRNKATAGADSFAVYINGGSGAGVSTANKDWLISKAPFDFSAMAKPTLSFWQTRRYSGNATRKVLVSTDYIAGSNPTTATWTELSIQDLTNDPIENTWTKISGVDLTAHKNTPFYLAFTYQCDTAGTYELAYDDILVENIVSIKNVKGANVGVQVLGEATNNRINLNIDMNANESVDIQVIDLLGRQVANQKANLVAGANRVNINSINLNAGMYVIRVTGKSGFGTVKTVIK